MNILVVEDNQDNLDLVTKVLTFGGHRVTAARTGLEALELVAREIPELVLMDLGLPGLDGWETTRRMREIPALAAIPIVALTAHALRPEDRKRAAEAGCSDYITKPFDRKKLLASIEQHERDTKRAIEAHKAAGGGR